MPETTSKLGIIGLATMGANLARNFANKKITTSVYNRTTKKTTEFIEEFGGKFLVGTQTMQEFVQGIEKPRKIMILVKAGDPVDAVIEELTPLLDEGDIVLDLGNSKYRDTERRGQGLNRKNVHYWGCGISGGEEGALHGPSLMPGGPKKSWKEIKPLLEAVAAKDFHGGKCVTYLGQGGSGHYIKMVHNGIEYGIIQIMAEAYDMLRLMFMMPAPQIGQIFGKYNKSKLNSFLFELASDVLQKVDDKENSGYLIDRVLDKAAQKGTGMWTVVDALERGIAVPTISEAVMSRITSGDKDKRVNMSEEFPKKIDRENLDLDKFIHQLDDALFAAVICTFAQGVELIQRASVEEKWNTNISEVMRIWQGGCIIRAKLLKSLQHCFEEESKEYGTHIFELPQTEANLKGNVGNLRKVLETAIRNQVPVPALSSALAYFEGMTEKNSSANLIQGLRDAFGAHTYKRTDRSGDFHSDWVKEKE